VRVRIEFKANAGEIKKKTAREKRGGGGYTQTVIALLEWSTNLAKLETKHPMT
jgi:hypothetical protein